MFLQLALLFNRENLYANTYKEDKPILKLLTDFT